MPPSAKAASKLQKKFKHLNTESKEPKTQEESQLKKNWLGKNSNIEARLKKDGETISDYAAKFTEICAEIEKVIGSYTQFATTRSTQEAIDKFKEDLLERPMYLERYVQYFGSKIGDSGKVKECLQKAQQLRAKASFTLGSYLLDEAESLAIKGTSEGMWEKSKEMALAFEDAYLLHKQNGATLQEEEIFLILRKLYFHYSYDSNYENHKPTYRHDCEIVTKKGHEYKQEFKDFEKQIKSDNLLPEYKEAQAEFCTLQHKYAKAREFYKEVLRYRAGKKELAGQYYFTAYSYAYTYLTEHRNKLENGVSVDKLENLIELAYENICLTIGLIEKSNNDGFDSDKQKFLQDRTSKILNEIAKYYTDKVAYSKQTDKQKYLENAKKVQAKLAEFLAILPHKMERKDFEDELKECKQRENILQTLEELLKPQMKTARQLAEEKALFERKSKKADREAEKLSEEETKAIEKQKNKIKEIASKRKDAQSKFLQPTQTQTPAATKTDVTTVTTASPSETERMYYEAYKQFTNGDYEKAQDGFSTLYRFALTNQDYKGLSIALSAIADCIAAKIAPDIIKCTEYYAHVLKLYKNKQDLEKQEQPKVFNAMKELVLASLPYFAKCIEQYTKVDELHKKALIYAIDWTKEQTYQSIEVQKQPVSRKIYDEIQQLMLAVNISIQNTEEIFNDTKSSLAVLTRVLEEGKKFAKESMGDNWYRDVPAEEQSDSAKALKHYVDIKSECDELSKDIGQTKQCSKDAIIAVDMSNFSKITDVTKKLQNKNVKASNQPETTVQEFSKHKKPKKPHKEDRDTWQEYVRDARSDLPAAGQILPSQATSIVGEGAEPVVPTIHLQQPSYYLPPSLPSLPVSFPYPPCLPHPGYIPVVPPMNGLALNPSFPHPGYVQVVPSGGGLAPNPSFQQFPPAHSSYQGGYQLQTPPEDVGNEEEDPTHPLAQYRRFPGNQNKGFQRT